MSRFRSLAILILFWIPILTLVVAGAYALWKSGNFLLLWWLFPVCWGTAHLLAWWSKKKRFQRREAEDDLPIFWTNRDRDAWAIVKRFAEEGQQAPASELVDINFYQRKAQELSHAIARHYHPSAKDPFHSLTIPELLAAMQLVTEDLSQLVEEYLPGNQYLTVSRWRSLGVLPDWYNAFSNVSYVISAIFGPTTAASRYVVSRLVLGPAFQLMKSNVLLWFYTSFINRVGMYTIEMNSGRLLVGAQAWREHVKKAMSKEGTTGAVETPEAVVKPVHSVTIAIVGQVKAGKSSLTNALLGDRQAAVDVLPLTNKANRYELHEADMPDKLVFVDTAGYGDDVLTNKEIDNQIRILSESDIVLMVMDAMNPAREPDRLLLERFDRWFKEHPKFKRPPILGVLTHIDALRPVMEWSPPYEGWHEENPQKAKEISIKEAVEFNRQQLAPQVLAVVPVCSDFDRKRVYGIDEWLFPEITALLDEARAVLLVRTLHQEAGRNKWVGMLQQIRNVGLGLLKASITNEPNSKPDFEPPLFSQKPKA